jgi:hypothetical protein
MAVLLFCCRFSIVRDIALPDDVMSAELCTDHHRGRMMKVTYLADHAIGDYRINLSSGIVNCRDFMVD